MLFRAYHGLPPPRPSPGKIKIRKIQWFTAGGGRKYKGAREQGPLPLPLLTLNPQNHGLIEAIKWKFRSCS
jgi:hypothetical protein